MPSVLITGANRGIGLAFAQSYAADGWEVHACCRHPDRAADLKDIGGTISIHRLEVTDALQVSGLARNLGTRALDLLINNAGVGDSKSSFGDLDYKEWLKVLSINTLAPLRMAEAFLAHLLRGEQRKLVNISSSMGSLELSDRGGHYAYRTSKAALNMATKTLATDLRDRKVIVAALNPGWVRTDLGTDRADLEPAQSVAAMRRTISGLTPDDSGGFFDRDGKRLPW